MNTVHDTASNGFPKTEFEPKQNVPGKRAAQIYRRILVGTDFTPASASAFEQGLLLARQNGAELLLIHVAAPPGTVNFMPPESFGAWAEYCLTEARQDLGELVQRASRAGVKAHQLLLEGHADDVIVGAAERLGVDLIVIGTHGRRGVSRFFMGSVAAHVVTRAPCAVLTARACNRTA